VSQNQHAEGHRWANIAEALIGRVQQKDDLTSLLSHKLSMLLQDEGKYDEALVRSQRALALGEKLFGRDHLRIGEYYHELGNVYYQQARYDESLASYARSAAIERKILGDDHPGLAANIFSMANVLGDRGEHLRALAENARALAIVARVQNDHPYAPQILNSMGADLLALGRAKEAFEKFSLAYQSWHRRVGESADTAMALQNMGTCKLRLKAPDEALRYVQQALDMSRRVVGTEHMQYGQILLALGDVYLDRKQPEQALAQYQRALAVSEKALSKDHPQVAAALVGIARVELARHAAGAAKAPLERAQAIYEKQGATDELASVRFALARALWSAPASAEDRPRAVALAEQARGVYARVSSDAAHEDLAAVSAWLADHR